MAATPTPRPTLAEPGPNPALAPLAGLNPALPLAVAFSGGADSTALLHAATALWPGQVRAVHVHHGLQVAADAFERHCQDACARLAVPLEVVRIDARHAPGESPEDAARQGRYRALAQAAQTAGARAVLLAQHADDQGETLLLALSRGAGLPGLAAMPLRFERHAVTFLRPLLGVAGADLRAWLAAAKVPFVEDPSNADTRLTRNRIRQELLPALDKSFPQWRDTFARSARHAAHAQVLLEEMAATDLADMGGEPALESLQRLSRLRQANVLRYWLRRADGLAPTAAQLEELLDQVADCVTRGHRLHLKVSKGYVTRDGPRLRFTPG